MKILIFAAKYPYHEEDLSQTQTDLGVTGGED